MVLLTQANTLNTARRPAHRPGLLLIKTNRHAVACSQYNMVAAAGKRHANYIVVGVKLNCDNPGCARITVSTELSLFHQPVLRRHNQLPLLTLVLIIFVKVADINNRGDCLVAEFEQVGDTSSAALPGHAWNVIDLQPIALAAIGKY